MRVGCATRRSRAPGSCPRVSGRLPAPRSPGRDDRVLGARLCSLGLPGHLCIWGDRLGFPANEGTVVYGRGGVGGW